MTIPYARVARAALLGAALLSPASLAAQSRPPRVTHLRNVPHVGVGYVASIPDLFIGFSALALTPALLRGAGLYADVKLSSSSPGNDAYFDPAMTISQAENQFGDYLFEEKSNWLTVDVAVVYALFPELALYGGGGYSRERHYRQYYDDSRTRGLQGFYWIKDPAASGDRVNAVGGALLRVGRHIVFQMGVEAKPRGADVGVMFTFPR